MTHQGRLEELGIHRSLFLEMLEQQIRNTAFKRDSALNKIRLCHAVVPLPKQS